MNEVTGVAIQGSTASNQFVSSFKVEFSPSGKTFYPVQENGVDKVCCILLGEGIPIYLAANTYTCILCGVQQLHGNVSD